MQPNPIVYKTMILGFLFILVGVLGGCTSDSLAPFQPEIGNIQDSFNFQATNVSNVSTTLVYAWNNSGTRATINHSTTTTAGSTLLVIKDSIGTTVYSKALSPSLNEPTSVGVAGSWSITLTLTNYSGTLNFRAQKL
ncbi:MAG TPA: hypothetical protein VL633_03310 [Bacteroidota bacterium]|nr:hypothetical protein [Bacteroidota bacterium]